MNDILSGRSRPANRTTALLALLLALGGCSEPDPPAVPKGEAGPVPASAQRAGDPSAGYRVIAEGQYMDCGLPYAAWQRLDPAARGTGGEPGRDLPESLSLTRDRAGTPVVGANCLWCHSARVNGQRVIGLGNESLDFTVDPRAGVLAAGQYVNGPQQTAAWNKWAQRVEAMAPYMITDTVGVNPAPNLTLALIAHRDRDTLAWLDRPALAPPPQKPLPISVPPWWRMAKKHAMFYNAMGRGDHARFMMMKSLVCADTMADFRRIDALFADVRAFIASIEPPPYPFAIDERLAATGQPLFELHCARCHGTYGPNPSYPNRVVPLAEIGTDPAYARQAYEDSDRFMDWFNRSWFGETARARPAPGYIAPPLDGVWATAPFLHNGSVPTLDTLLESARRPTYWTRSFESDDFDPQAVGWRYRALDAGKDGDHEDGLRKRIYDTTLTGYSNAGHLFGDGLDPSQRRALIEYLKTL